MSVYLKDSKVLLNSGNVATNAACCCGAGGACCTSPGVCGIVASEQACDDINGNYYGDGTTCSTPTPTNISITVSFSGSVNSPGCGIAQSCSMTWNCSLNQSYVFDPCTCPCTFNLSSSSNACLNCIETGTGGTIFFGVHVTASDDSLTVSPQLYSNAFCDQLLPCPPPVGSTFCTTQFLGSTDGDFSFSPVSWGGWAFAFGTYNFGSTVNINRTAWTPCRCGGGGGQNESGSTTMNVTVVIS